MDAPRVALVTGASRGIGKTIAEEFAREGVFVIGTATAEKGIAEIEETLQRCGGQFLALQLNVADADSMASFFAALEARQITPSIVVNNAGITRDNLLMRMKDDDWDAVIAANLTSIFKLSKHFVRAMVKARYGRIINLTSIVGVSGNAGQTNYAAAKAGIIGFTKSLAQEVASRNITVNAVAPGLIDTDMTRALTEPQRELTLQRIPANRLGTTAEIAATVLFLASDGAAYITGQTLHVNGGMLMV